MEKLDFKGRVAIVTGGGQGMGRDYALMLASRGARLVVNDIIADRAEETVQAIADASGIAVVDSNDVTTHAANLVQSAIDNFGVLDVVINNAAKLSSGSPFWDTDEDEWWRIFNSSFRGVVEVSRQAMPHLIESGTGRLINIASTALMGAPYASAYGATKAAIWGLGNSLTAEAQAVGVQVTTILPTAYTPMSANAIENPTIRNVLRNQFPSHAVASFVTWLAHQDTTVFGESFEVGGVSASRIGIAMLPRTTVNRSTPESWADYASEVLQREDNTLTPLQSAAESFRAKLVYAAPELESIIPADPTEFSRT